MQLCQSDFIAIGTTGVALTSLRIVAPVGDRANISGLWIGLFVADVRWGAGAIEGEDLELPFDWDSGWQIARGFVASLIFELSVDRENCSILRERAAQACGADFYVLADAEGALENGHALFDCWQIEDFGRGVNERL